MNSPLFVGYHGFGRKKFSGKIQVELHREEKWTRGHAEDQRGSCCIPLHNLAVWAVRCFTMLWNVVEIIYKVPHCCTWLDNVVRCNIIVHNVAWNSKITHNVVEEERGQNPRYSRSNGEERAVDWLDILKPALKVLCAFWPIFESFNLFLLSVASQLSNWIYWSTSF